MFMRLATRPQLALVFFAALAITSGCNCRQSNVGASYAEIGVVWKDTDGNTQINRDAVYDFGTAFVGESIPKQLIIRNIGNGALQLVSLEVVDNGATVSIGDDVKQDAAFDIRFMPNTQVDATAEADIAMSFTPRSGRDYLVTLRLTGGGTRPDDNTATIVLKGKGQGGACDIPATLDFGLVPVGERFTLPVQLNNPGSINGTAVVGDLMGIDAAIFDVAPKGNVAVPAMTGARVTVGFSPTQKRDYTATVKMKGAGDCPEQDVLLKGTGADDVLTWSPSAFDYGYVSPGVDAPRQVVFINQSKVPIVLTNVVTSMPTDFFYRNPPTDQTTQFTVAGGGVPVPMTVTCKPAGLGPRGGNLTFDTGLKKTPSGLVTLTCYGGGPRIKVTPRPNLGFGKVAFYTGAPVPVTRKLTVANVGTKPPNNDVYGNLFLGQLGTSGSPDGGTIPGQLPLVAINPTDPNTALDEFSLGLPANYNTSTGLPAIAGQNLADLSITLTPKTIGMKSAELIIYSNDSTEPAVKIQLSADAEVLPPCNLQVTPTSLNFGLVAPPAFKDLPVTVTNLGQNPGDLCYLSGVEIASGSNPAYSIVGGALASKELQPKESFQVVVRVSPPGPVSQNLTTFTGALTFSVNSPSTPTHVIPLTTAVGPSCLAIAPDDLDFGAVKPGCSSATRTFSAYNVCNTNITLTGFTVQAPAGQPAGGPNCPGTSYCPEFLLVSTPSIPSGGLVLAPGSTPITFQAKYKALDLGPDNGAISVEAIQSGQNVAYLVNLRGSGDANGLQTDTFTQDVQPKADILLTVDDSGSMSDKQTNLANNFTAFIQYAVGAGVDYQIGVTTTDDDAPYCPGLGLPCTGGEQGRLVARNGNPKILVPGPNIATQFSDQVKVGTDGSGTEQGLGASTHALTPPLISNENAGLLRYDANLAVVVVSDAGDQSPQPFSYYFNRLLNVKGFNRASMFTFNVIGPLALTAPGSCTYDDYNNAATYIQMANQTNGVVSEICVTDWSQKLKDLGKTAFGFRTVFYLTSSPDLSNGKMLDVKVNGAAAPAGSWSYDPAINALKFDPLKTPTSGQTLTVTYFTACL